MTGDSGSGGEGTFPEGTETPQASGGWVTEDPGLRRNGNSVCPLFLRANFCFIKIGLFVLGNL